MTSLSAVVSITVVLLGGPQGLGPFTAEGPYAGRLAAPLGYGFPLQGDKIMYDAAAGLTTILGPDEAAIRGLFEENGGSKAAVIEPIIEEGLYTWPESQFEFLWPKDRPQYYLEKLPGLYRGYTVYGRIELVDKEGYTVSVQPTGGPDELTVQVEFANKTLSGGKYDETIRAFVGRPTLIKTVVTTDAPLTFGQKTLLVWQPPPSPRMMGAAGGPLPGMMMMPGGTPMGLGGAPDWAVGEWGMMSEPGVGTVIIQRDGTVLGEGGGLSLSGSIDQSGRLTCKGMIDGETVAIVTGRLSANGTGEGTAHGESVTIPWTATRLRAAETAQAAPSWAVGDWELTVSGDEGSVIMTVHPDGNIFISGLPGSGSVEARGQMEFRVAGDNNEVLTGTLSPSGAGSGMIQEGDRKATWTARLRAAGAAQPPPSWAIGEWELTTPEEDDSVIMTVHPNGSISITGAPGSGSVEPSGQVRFRAEGEDAGLTGMLSPSGTGSGMIQEGDRKATWTATRVGGPDPAASAEQLRALAFKALLEANAQGSGLGTSLPGIPAQSAPTLRVLDREPHPTGVAVLLEVTAGGAGDVQARARRAAERALCLANLRQAGVALFMYASDHEERLPAAGSWREALAKYISNQAILTCPITGTQYVFNKVLGGVNREAIQGPAGTPMLWEPAIDAEGLVGPHEGQFGVCYADGHVQMVDKVPDIK